ncbi:ABC transporter ATP-binding protein [filamentous cyanobacterium LEGE 11480]|uniref:Spermidine/putrescine import ATP-binding protein PotA n=1 Tax=Romeriopsis navalis LEGE 11480 TaxID=2777977 RepID=A0A928VK97_9CYAN|nr:ABC transporter ATP-binding protein [Romeriopsis navalis]MBE9030163.1 ABC transporter ATP-binding protein [Romeriopsis navalis LEGE 11480]
MSQAVTTRKRFSETSAAADIELRQVFKVFADDAAVQDVSLTVQRGEFFSILGPSGCGKTTTLRLIAGFEQPTAGDVLIRQRSMLNVPAYHRPVNTVFQSYALFNHLTVRENVAFGLRIQKLGKAEVQQRVSAALRSVKMTDYASRYPMQLSGGQQQRVALARALVNRPAVVLLDEPLGALDLQLRKEMQVELAALQQELGLTFVMVTHDQEEALSLSDRIAVMNNGKIEQIGTPREIYNSPDSQFVAEFIGDTNLLKAKVEGAHPNRMWLKTQSGLKLTAQTDPTGPQDGPVAVSIRPEKITLMQTPVDRLENCFDGQLENVMYLGSHHNCFVRLRSGDQIIVRQPHGSTVPEKGAIVYVAWAEDAATVLSDV